MLIELGEFREAKLWADKALERFPNEPELLAAKAVALGRSGDLQGALAFSDASIEERGDTPYVWLARGDVMLARAESRGRIIVLRKRCCSRPGTGSSPGWRPGSGFITNNSCSR
jgi:tetratricopeptide (TPR) repeat protein